jgi:undecaprenyl-phosphate galactose phosphotransferase
LWFPGKYPLYKYILALLDWLTLVAAFIIAYWLRGRPFAGDVLLLGPYPYGEIVFVLPYSAAAIFILQYLNLYKIKVFITLIDHTIRIVKALFFTILGVAVLSFFTKAPIIVDSRLTILYFAFVAFGLFLIVRVIFFRKAFLLLSRYKILRRNVLIIGAGETGKKLASSLYVNNNAALNVVGFLDDDVPIGRVVFAGKKVIGKVDEIEVCVREFDVAEIVICLENVGYIHLMEVLERCTATSATVKISSPLYDIIPSRLFIEEYGNIPVVGVSQSFPSPINERYKKIFDMVLVAVGLVFLSPLLAIVAALIKLDSPGSVLFRQLRIGKNGRPFMFYKFRSMYEGSDEDEVRRHNATQFIKTKRQVRGGEEVSTKIVNEARVTRVGKWLRKMSLDELPQLLNVLKGEMSLVGPRPCLPYEWDHYEEWHKRRLSVLPGCTGVWQVSGRSAVGFEDMVVLDLYYIQNASVLLDFRLLLKTIPVMILGIGAK